MTGYCLGGLDAHATHILRSPPQKNAQSASPRPTLRAYGVVDKTITNALAMFARHEAIMLDPVYTGKAAVGMIDLVKTGYFDGSRGVVFLHTGGTPAIFAYEDDLLIYLK